MTWFARLFVTAPIRAAVALQVLAYVLTFLVTIVTLLVFRSAEWWVPIVTGELSVLGLSLVLIARLGWWRRAGITGGTFASAGLWVGALLPALAAAATYGLVFGPRAAPPAVWLVAIVVGLSEEVMNRGLILSALVPRGTIRGVMLSSALFGLSHLTNVLDAPLVAVAAQVFGATCNGALWAAVRTRGASIWLLVIGHALVDLADVYFGYRLDDATAQAVGLEIGIGIATALVAVAVLVRRRTGDDGSPAVATSL